MIALVFDTETTGVPIGRRTPVTDPAYPRVVELAMVLIDTETGVEQASASFLVRPEGWIVPLEASRIHGIDHAMATRMGVPIRVAAAALTNLVRVADCVVGHNVEFDYGMMHSELHRLGQDYAALLPVEKSTCTADMGTPICALPPTERMLAAGFNKPKRPTLSEMHGHLFGDAFDGAHRAMADVRATARCYIELIRREAK